jgi:hypothetical protein
MPARSGPFVIETGEGGETRIVIALELTINLNANGLSASIAAVPKQGDPSEDDDDFSGFVVPEFQPSSKIDFGKKVE